MTLRELIRRVRSQTRDFTNSVFREQDIIDFINEGIDRFKQTIPELRGMRYLIAQNEKPILLPQQYCHLLAVYSTSRCFSQDENHYQGSTLMNEFEVKLAELKAQIENGDIVIVDPDSGLPITSNNIIDYVDLKPYWGVGVKKKSFDDDEGVEGVR